MKSFTIDLGGPVHVADHGGDGPAMVLVHGLGGSHLNWASVAPSLSERFRVLAIDLVGFGHSPPAGRPVTMETNREVLDRFLREHLQAPALLVGNSMGGLLSMLEASRSPDLVSGLVLVNPAFPRRLIGIDRRVLALFGISAIPYVAEYLFRRRGETVTPEVVVEEFMALCCRDPETISRETIAMHLEFARRKHERPWADDSFLQATRSLLRVMMGRTAIDRAVKAVRAPTLLISGAHDRLVPVEAIGRIAKLRPDWSHASLGHTGHVPMLEDSEGFVKLVTEWVERSRTGAAAVSA